MPIWAIDLDGLEEKPTTKGTNEGEAKTTESETKYAPLFYKNPSTPL